MVKKGLAIRLEFELRRSRSRSSRVSAANVDRAILLRRELFQEMRFERIVEWFWKAESESPLTKASPESFENRSPSSAVTTSRR